MNKITKLNNEEQLKYSKRDLEMIIKISERFNVNLEVNNGLITNIVHLTD